MVVGYVGGQADDGPCVRLVTVIIEVFVFVLVWVTVRGLEVGQLRSLVTCGNVSSSL